MTNFHPGQLYLLVAPRAAGRSLMNAFLVQHAIAGAVLVIGIANQIDQTAITTLIRQKTRFVSRVKKRITLIQASCCRQLLSELVDLSPKSSLIMIYDFLDLFTNEVESDPVKRLQILKLIIRQLNRLKRTSPVIVNTALLPDEKEYLNLLACAAQHVWRFEEPASIATPLFLRGESCIPNPFPAPKTYRPIKKSYSIFAAPCDEQTSWY